MFFAQLGDALDRVETGEPFQKVFDQVVSLTASRKRQRLAVMFIGNGGSAAIASHMATDFLKNGGYKSTCFNDGAQLTCIGNDLGFEKVFELPINRFGKSGDMLFAISSSGESKDILNAAHAAREQKMYVVTLSGFSPDNKLRRVGNFNFYVPSESYGIVETAHLAICHAVLDTVMAHDQG